MKNEMYSPVPYFLATLYFTFLKSMDQIDWGWEYILLPLLYGFSMIVVAIIGIIWRYRRMGA